MPDDVTWHGFQHILTVELDDVVSNAATYKAAVATALDITDQWAAGIIATHAFDRHFGRLCLATFTAARCIRSMSVAGAKLRPDGSFGPRWAYLVTEAAYDRVDFWADRSARFVGGPESEPAHQIHLR